MSEAKSIRVLAIEEMRYGNCVFVEGRKAV